MAYDNRPNLSNRRFEQLTGDTLTLCGTNNYYGLSGINSTHGYRISGVTFVSAGVGINTTRIGRNTYGNSNATAIGAGTCAMGINSVSIGCGAYTSGNSTISIGKSSKAHYGCSTVIGSDNISCSPNGNIFGGYGNTICSGNTNVTLIGFNSTVIPKNCYSNTVVVPNLAIKTAPSGSGTILVRNSTTGNLMLTTAVTGASSGLYLDGSVVKLGGDIISGSTWVNVCGASILSFGSVIGTLCRPSTTYTALSQSVVGSRCVSCCGYCVYLYPSGGTLAAYASNFVVGKFKSDATFSGVRYDNNYSANYTSRSLPDVAYVTGQTSQAITGGSGGILKSEKNLKLGGVVSTSGIRSLCVCGSGIFDIRGEGTCAPQFFTSAHGQNFVGGSTNCGYQIDLIASGLTSGVVACTSKFCVCTYEASLFAGIQYGADYSANYTNRSLVDKEYVDTHGGSGGSGFTIACNGLTSENSATVKLGGALSNNTSITGAYTLSFTGGTQLNTQYGLQISGVTMFRAPSSTLTSVYIGQYAGTFAPTNTGVNNIGIGPYALYKNCNNGNNNVAIGFCTLCCNTTGYRNVAIGCMALANNSVGTSNVGVGVNALYCNYCGVSNVGIGTFALYSNLCGCCNVAIGYTALNNSTNGSSNIAIGTCTLNSNTVGCTNIGIGVVALNSNTAGSTNIGIGTATLRSNISGSSNIAIGTCAGFYETGSNKLYIANSADKSLIYGEFDNEKLCIRGKLHVSGLTNSTKSDVIYYDSSTKELSYGTAPSGSGSTGGSGFTIACNGLCGETSSIIKLGGLLDEATTLCLTSGSLTLAATSVGASYQFANSGMILSKCNSCIYLTNNGADFKLVSCYGKCVNIGNSGLTYGGDYSANAGARWIPDKAYVDAHAGGITGATNLGTGNGTIYKCVSANKLQLKTLTGGTNVTLGFDNCYIKINASSIGWSNLALGSTVVGCDTPALNSVMTSVLFGVGVGKNTTSGFGNAAFGYHALNGNTTGCYNIAIGNEALYCNTIGKFNVAQGYRALYGKKDGCFNIAIGHSAIANTCDGGQNNIGIGTQSLYNVISCENIGIGVCTLVNTTTGCYNIANGSLALCSNTTGSFNIGTGVDALRSNITGMTNIAIGESPLLYNTYGNRNIGLGYFSLFKNTCGNENIAIGCCAARSNTIGNNNIAIGNNSLPSNFVGCNNIAIGYYAGYDINSSNKLSIANCADCSLIYGEFDNKCLKLCADVDLPIAGSGLVLTSSGGTRYCLYVTNGGALCICAV